MTQNSYWFEEEVYNGVDIKEFIDNYSNESVDKEILKLEKNIKEVLSKLYDKDKYLIHNRSYEDLDNHVSERAVVHRFARYFEDYYIKKNWVETSSL